MRRRTSGTVFPLRLRLDHGDLLVMDGLNPIGVFTLARCVWAAGSSGKPYFYRLGHTTHCVLSTSRRSGLCAPNVCERFSRAKFPLVGGRENKWSSFWGLVLLLLILVTVLLASTWIHIRRRHRHSGQRPSRSAVYLTSRGRARLVGRRRWRLSRRRQSSKGVFFYFPGVVMFG